MSVQLLDKTRKINNLLHNNRNTKVAFNDICSVLSDTLNANTLVVSKKGKILGLCLRNDIEPINVFIPNKVGDYVDNLFNDRLLNILSTKENINLQTLGIDSDISYEALLVPIYIAGKRLGSLFVYRPHKIFDIDDIILGEYGGTVVSLEMLRSVDEETAEEERKVQFVKAALGSLSYSEVEAVEAVFNSMDGDEGILVASKIADSLGITRSVIVNALRKLESAGVIETHSSGKKGTNIKVINKVIYDELENAKK